MRLPIYYEYFQWSQLGNHAKKDFAKPSQGNTQQQIALKDYATFSTPTDTLFMIQKRIDVNYSQNLCEKICDLKGEDRYDAIYI